jgi:hypothetical protein
MSEPAKHPLPDPNRSPERLESITAALKTFLVTMTRFEPVLEDEPGTRSIDGCLVIAENAALHSLYYLEKMLNPKRYAFGTDERSSPNVDLGAMAGVSRVYAMAGVSRLHNIIAQVIERWDVPEICDDRPLGIRGVGTITEHEDRNDRGDDPKIIKEVHVNRIARSRTLLENEKSQLRWCLEVFQSTLAAVTANTLNGDGKKKRRPRNTAKTDILSTLMYLASKNLWTKSAEEVADLAKVARSRFYDLIRDDDKVEKAWRKYQNEKLGRGPSRRDDY